MKNIQVIDSALNCTDEFFAVPDEKFALLFPAEGQELAFIEDLKEQGIELPHDWWDETWANRLSRDSVQGIHGTIFYGFPERRKIFQGRTWAHEPLGRRRED